MCLQRHQNLVQLADMESHFAITQSLGCLVAGEDSSDDRTRNKRRYSGPNNTGSSVKRVRQAEGIEEELDTSMMQALAADSPYITTKVPAPRLDISTMMQGHATCNLDITTMMHHAPALGVDISTMMHRAPALGVDISTMMQQALVSGQLDISMEMQLAETFGVNAENGGHVACADVREPETFSGIATDAATPWGQTTTNPQPYMFPARNTTQGMQLLHFEQQEYE